jgi:processive 1,2-diacylglycerol beta-glucosyltransferase
MPPRVLFMINAGRERAPGIVRRLLAIEPLHLTVTVGRDDDLREQIEKIAAELGRSIEIHGWTQRMPELLMTHHVLIGKAGGATVQETIAARTPMLLTQIVPGQEEGIANFIVENGCGAIAETPQQIGKMVNQVFANDGALWLEWHANISRISRPDAVFEIARFILNNSPQVKNETQLTN